VRSTHGVDETGDAAAVAAAGGAASSRACAPRSPDMSPAGDGAFSGGATPGASGGVTPAPHGGAGGFVNYPTMSTSMIQARVALRGRREI
jgi:hypothetical protein